MFAKILIANRGEIAVRIARTAREMGIATVAVYSEADRDALHVRTADEAYLIGPASPASSYLDGARLIAVAQRAAAQAVHPGYGFLAENAGFARDVVAAGLTWIGPHADAIDAMGDKLRARRAMRKARVPVVPGGTEPIEDVAEARRAARTIGLPLALKASGGGGGKGLKIARTVEEIEPAFQTAQREAEAYFKNGTIYAERYLDNPKHIEIQVLADKHGNVVHVGERDCSLQRRHQELWEEAPVALPPALQRKMRDAAIRAARAIGYDSVGTIECLVSGDAFYFLEMNTRIQVEHTVTEMISGLDLIREQIRVAAGEPLGFRQADVTFTGASIEGRINAEDPARDFHPAPGTIRAYREPGGLGVRVDSAAFAGWTISPDYDSLIAKLVVWAPDRAQAIARLRRALDEYVIAGVPTTVPLLRALCDHPSVIDASYGTATLEAFAKTWSEARPSTAALRASAQDDSSGDVVRVEVNERLYRVRLVDTPRPLGNHATARRAPRLDAVKASRAQSAGNVVASPMHGIIVEINVTEGANVDEGQVVAVIEAMKMMNEVRAHRSGTVARVHSSVGDAVEAGSPIVSFA
ncbi:MAG: acetyl-CoA carboxylase biotin carboxylase subunit [Candidatus Eremiobacteraeota bacterium]|nr:acetyl-CoA carboxylase biotin carboxylase subunit [Candidatus Eremiobacteraeota bacterium]